MLARVYNFCPIRRVELEVIVEYVRSLRKIRVYLVGKKIGFGTVAHFVVT